MPGKLEICPICEEGGLVPKVEQAESIVDGEKVMLDLHYHECDKCGSQIGTAADTLNNKQIMIEACKKVP